MVMQPICMYVVEESDSSFVLTGNTAWSTYTTDHVVLMVMVIKMAMENADIYEVLPKRKQQILKMTSTRV